MGKNTSQIKWSEGEAVKVIGLNIISAIVKILKKNKF